MNVNCELTFFKVFSQFAIHKKRETIMFTEEKKIFLKDFGRKLKFTLPDGTLIEKGQDGEDLLGMFDKTYTDATLGFLATKNSKPRLTCIEEDVVSVVKNSTVQIEGITTTYKVFDNTDDGTGFAIIELSKS